MVNKYPYTDLHELNLDWLLAEFKKLHLEVVDLDTTVKQFTEFVTNYFANLDVQDEINNKLDQMASDGTLAALIQPLFDEYKVEIDAIVADQNHEIEVRMNNQDSNIADIGDNVDVLTGRMDEFASLPPGSTAGNAELLDIRVGADGTTYASAGDAVRHFDGIILDYAKESLLAEWNMLRYWPVLEQTYIANDGTKSSNSSYYSFEKVPCEASKIYTAKNGGYNYSGQLMTATADVIFYDSAESVISNVTNSCTFETPSGCAFVSISFKYAGGTNKSWYYLTNTSQTVEGTFFDADNGTKYVVEDTLGAQRAYWDAMAYDKIKEHMFCTNGTYYAANDYFMIDMMPVKPNMHYYFYTSVDDGQSLHHTARFVTFFDSSKNFISQVQYVNAFDTPSTCRYMTISTIYNDRSTCDKGSIYLSPVGLYAGFVRNEITYERPTIYNTKGGYIHKRRPTIAFVFDGEYVNNLAAADVFLKNGERCTFALQYDTTFPNHNIDAYMYLQKEGFEIGVHSSQAVGTQPGSGTDAQVKQYIEDSYSTFRKTYGFNISTFVSLQGNTRASAYPVIEGLYELGFTKTNHSGTDNPILSLSDDPYELWRYCIDPVVTSLAQAEAAVASCVANTGLLVFYSHAQGTADNITMADLETLLQYAQASGAQILTAYDAIADFYAIRRSEI